MLSHGLMMEQPLLISAILEHAAGEFGSRPICSREGHGGLFRYTYADCARRARRLANALKRLGLGPGSFIATLAWNNHRHLESYYAVSGSAMVIHTCNPRLHLDQLCYIINHAEDRAVLFDPCFAELIRALMPRCPAVEHWVALCGPESLPPMAEATRVLCYEEMLAAEEERFEWPQFDERTQAALCYTSGTTGHPKGAMFTHRAIVLNSMMGCTAGVLSISPRDTVLPIVPMFHVNGWCIPYAAPIGGAALVLPGPRLDPQALFELFESEQVTVSAGVPTVWLVMVQYLEQRGLRFSSLRRVVIGGAAAPPHLIAKLADGFGIEVRQGWGMTETVAVATLSSLTAEQRRLPAEQQHAIIARQGRSVFGIEMKVIDELGASLPRDGVSQGELLVRGQWVISGYYKMHPSPLREGWFPTGDVATIDASGLMQIRDRSKDLIKTGGEWISSIDLENTVCAHPAVAHAAVIGVRHPKWQERPLLFIVRREGHSLEREEILTFLQPRIARLCLPDEVIFLTALPVGGTGKVQKAALREQYGHIFDERPA